MRLNTTQIFAYFQDFQNKSYAQRLFFMFGLVYFAQGLAQNSGLVSQPLAYFLKQTLHFDQLQSSTFLAVLTLPWIIKPLYGLISDFVPLLGYRRKTWLLLLNTISAMAFLMLSGESDAYAIRTCLIFTAISTAASDVIIDALMVENGNRFGMVGKFQAVQWFWFYTAQVFTSIVGGWLADISTPGTGLHVAALITMFAPLVVALLTWTTIEEEKAEIRISELKATWPALKADLLSGPLKAVALFLAFWNFSPSFGTPMYYHMIDDLKFSQTFIGYLGAIGSVGAVLGAFAYGRWFTRISLNYQLVFSISAGIIGTLSYLSVVDPSDNAAFIMVCLSFVFGIAGAISMLTIMTLAGRSCPTGAEGFAFAVLMSVSNGFAQISDIIGSWLYVSVLDKQLDTLIIISAVFTGFCFALMPILKAVPKESEKDAD